MISLSRLFADASKHRFRQRKYQVSIPVILVDILEDAGFGRCRFWKMRFLEIILQRQKDLICVILLPSWFFVSLLLLLMPSAVVINDVLKDVKHDSRSDKVERSLLRPILLYSDRRWLAAQTVNVISDKFIEFIQVLEALTWLIRSNTDQDFSLLLCF